MTNDPRLAKVILRKDFPDLEIKTISFLGNGWNNVAYLINNEVVFRLPTEREGTGANRQRKVTREVALLKEVYRKVGINTPIPLYVAPDHSYFGYQYLPGINLENKPEALRTAEQQESYIKLWVQMAARIAEVVPNERAFAIGLEPFTYKEALIEVAYAIENRLVPNEAEYLARLCLNEYAARYEKAATQSVTLHADMSWLVDENNSITALIDWTDTCIGPPEHQLANLAWEMSPLLVSKAIEQYTKITGYQPDERLVYLDYVRNAIGDIGLLVREGKPLSDPGIQHVLDSVKYWANQRILNYI